MALHVWDPPALWLVGTHPFPTQLPPLSSSGQNAPLFRTLGIRPHFVPTPMCPPRTTFPDTFRDALLSAVAALITVLSLSRPHLSLPPAKEPLKGRDQDWFSWVPRAQRADHQKGHRRLIKEQVSKSHRPS